MQSADAPWDFQSKSPYLGLFDYPKEFIRNYDIVHDYLGS